LFLVISHSLFSFLSFPFLSIYSFSFLVLVFTKIQTKAKGSFNSSTPGAAIQLHAPSSHRLYVNYCKECIGIMSLVQDWNYNVEEGLHQMERNQKISTENELLKTTVSKLNDIILRQEEENEGLRNETAELKANEAWFQKWKEGLGVQGKEEGLLNKLHAQRQINEMAAQDIESTWHNAQARFEQKYLNQLEHNRKLQLQLDFEAQASGNAGEKITALQEQLLKAEESVQERDLAVRELQATVGMLRDEATEREERIATLERAQAQLLSTVEEKSVEMLSIRAQAEAREQGLVARAEDAEGELEDKEKKLELLSEALSEKTQEYQELWNSTRPATGAALEEQVRRNISLLPRHVRLSAQHSIEKKTSYSLETGRAESPEEKLEAGDVREEVMLAIAKLIRPQLSLRVVATAVRFLVRFRRAIDGVASISEESSLASDTPPPAEEELDEPAAPGVEVEAPMAPKLGLSSAVPKGLLPLTKQPSAPARLQLKGSGGAVGAEIGDDSARESVNTLMVPDRGNWHAYHHMGALGRRREIHEFKEIIHEAKDQIKSAIEAKDRFKEELKRREDEYMALEFERNHIFEDKQELMTDKRDLVLTLEDTQMALTELKVQFNELVDEKNSALGQLETQTALTAQRAQVLLLHRVSAQQQRALARVLVDSFATTSHRLLEMQVALGDGTGNDETFSATAKYRGLEKMRSFVARLTERVRAPLGLKLSLPDSDTTLGQSTNNEGNKGANDNTNTYAQQASLSPGKLQLLSPLKLAMEPDLPVMLAAFEADYKAMSQLGLNLENELSDVVPRVGILQAENREVCAQLTEAQTRITAYEGLVKHYEENAGSSNGKGGKRNAMSMWKTVGDSIGKSNSNSKSRLGKTMGFSRGRYNRSVGSVSSVSSLVMGGKGGRRMSRAQRKRAFSHSSNHASVDSVAAGSSIAETVEEGETLSRPDSTGSGCGSGSGSGSVLEPQQQQSSTASSESDSSKARTELERVRLEKEAQMAEFERQLLEQQSRAQVQQQQASAVEVGERELVLQRIALEEEAEAVKRRLESEKKQFEAEAAAAAKQYEESISSAQAQLEAKLQEQLKAAAEAQQQQDADMEQQRAELERELSAAQEAQTAGQAQAGAEIARLDARMQEVLKHRRETLAASAKERETLNKRIDVSRAEHGHQLMLQRKEAQEKVRRVFPVFFLLPSSFSFSLSVPLVVHLHVLQLLQQEGKRQKEVENLMAHHEKELTERAAAAERAAHAAAAEKKEIHRAMSDQMEQELQRRREEQDAVTKSLREKMAALQAEKEKEIKEMMDRVAAAEEREKETAAAQVKPEGSSGTAVDLLVFHTGRDHEGKETEAAKANPLLQVSVYRYIYSMFLACFLLSAFSFLLLLYASARKIKHHRGSNMCQVLLLLLFLFTFFTLSTTTSFHTFAHTRLVSRL
jgi:hypothetical protein